MHKSFIAILVVAASAVITPVISAPLGIRGDLDALAARDSVAVEKIKQQACDLIHASKLKLKSKCPNSNNQRSDSDVVAASDPEPKHDDVEPLIFFRNILGSPGSPGEAVKAEALRKPEGVRYTM
ncbi:hypothetical protein EI94DRAFT_1717204 [Lactarius quietus]|nr:hypothetical protein EI94DRAFT_1717204 [Lactarius quietus]